MWPLVDICSITSAYWQIIDEISPRSRDSIVGFGERLGCKLITAVLRDRVGVLDYSPAIRAYVHVYQNIDAEFVSLENIIPPDEGENFSDSDTLGQDFYDRVAGLVAEFAADAVEVIYKSQPE